MIASNPTDWEMAVTAGKTPKELYAAYNRTVRNYPNLTDLAQYMKAQADLLYAAQKGNDHMAVEIAAALVVKYRPDAFSQANDPEIIKTIFTSSSKK